MNSLEKSLIIYLEKKHQQCSVESLIHRAVGFCFLGLFLFISLRETKTLKHLKVEQKNAIFTIKYHLKIFPKFYVSFFVCLYKIE